MSLLFNMLFPPPPSIFVTAMSVISFASMASAGFSEIKGKHMQYSKFRNSRSQEPVAKRKEIELSGRTGMLIAYTPAFLVGLCSLGLFSNDDFRFLLVDLALTTHFFKRVFEVREILQGFCLYLCFMRVTGSMDVLFIHKYSGGMILDSVIPISLSYTIITATMIYNQHLTQNMVEPLLDLKYTGVVIFLLGIFGNLYHHLLLAKLRKNDNEGYKIPKGGLFNLLICPHYFFEILGFVGISLISQTIYPLCYTVGTTMYLMGRSYASRRWYLSKFPNFPKEVKAIIPFLF